MPKPPLRATPRPHVDAAPASRRALRVPTTSSTRCRDPQHGPGSGALSPPSICGWYPFARRKARGEIAHVQNANGDHAEFKFDRVFTERQWLTLRLDL